MACMWLELSSVVSMSDDPHRAVLRPKNPGESLKVAESVLRKRDRNLKAARKRIEKATWAATPPGCNPLPIHSRFKNEHAGSSTVNYCNR